MEDIKITPNGGSISAMMIYGRMMQELADTLQVAYNDNSSFDLAKKLLSLSNGYAEILGLPEIDIDFEFIEKARTKK
jgi:hypothetical protein